MSKFSAKRLLPPTVAYKWSAFHLYRIGLSADTIADYRSNKLWFNRPILIFTVYVVYIIERIICLFISADNWQLFALLGEWNYFWGIRHLMDIILILLTIITAYPEDRSKRNVHQNVYLAKL